MADKLPYFPFYPGDWRRDSGVQSLRFHDRGVWWEMLCLMHDCEPRGKLMTNGRAMTVHALAQNLHLPLKSMNKTLRILKASGVVSVCPDTGALMNRRMVRDEAIRRKKIAAGKLGGNPALLKSLLNQQVNPSSTTGPPSDSCSESEPPAGEHVSCNSSSTGETKARARGKDSQGSPADERKSAWNHKPESEFIVEAERVFGSETMEQWGSYWRTLYRDNATKCWRVLFAVSEDIKGGKAIDNPGGYARDLWNRFAD